ncbi:hypothetical protein PoB_000638400 [Plakobranchus ocellatus]|uniref:Uncharacterized protein n=1 Tax=Plakobranchus ocellatus TaxID=259542 RepID=A0AAV3YC96_9GAST|nr:hypothetical protein PoB_000638400 [Plakobranchus ocellatus]
MYDRRFSVLRGKTLKPGQLRVIGNLLSTTIIIIIFPLLSRLQKLSLQFLLPTAGSEQLMRQQGKRKHLRRGLVDRSDIVIFSVSKHFQRCKKGGVFAPFPVRLSQGTKVRKKK